MQSCLKNCPGCKNIDMQNKVSKSIIYVVCLRNKTAFHLYPNVFFVVVFSYFLTLTVNATHGGLWKVFPSWAVMSWENKFTLSLQEKCEG